MSERLNPSGCPGNGRLDNVRSGLDVISTGTNPRHPAVPPLGVLTTDRRASGWQRTLWYLLFASNVAPS
ncbi:MAG TPA: hypothetical protein VHV10_07755, partial [Ktedonobacteraceae bacterium]|nr:hypothetical protein [Ktedonobacteraceae bacterium]